MKAIYYFKALSDKTRLRLFSLLINNELNVNEIVDIMDMGQSRISRHLKILTDSGLLSSRRDGLWVFYTTNIIEYSKNLILAIKEIIQNEKQIIEDQLHAKRVIDERINKSRRFFDSIAGDWEALKRDIIGDFDLTGYIYEKINKCDVLVDLGCGTCDLLLILKDKSNSLIGVDNSSRMLEIARKRFSDYTGLVELRLGELDHLPLKDLEADCAVLNMVLHHLPSPADGIREACRVLKAGKSLLIADFDKHNNEQMRIKFGDRWLGFEKREIMKILSANGFDSLKFEQINLTDGLKVNLFISSKK